MIIKLRSIQRAKNFLEKYEKQFWNPFSDLRIISDVKNLGSNAETRKATIDTFDFIITDIAGVRYIKSNLGSQFKHGVECKLRVLDSFGTDEIFNDRYSKIKNNVWGKLGLNLKQFWTFYPHNKECLIKSHARLKKK